MPSPGVTYDRPDSTYGPFNWTVTEGGGKLETAEDVNVNGTRKNVAYYTPSEPGVSYLTATTKDGQYHVNFAVVCLPVQAIPCAWMIPGPPCIPWRLWR